MNEENPSYIEKLKQNKMFKSASAYAVLALQVIMSIE